MIYYVQVSRLKDVVRSDFDFSSEILLHALSVIYYSQYITWLLLTRRQQREAEGILFLDIALILKNTSQLSEIIKMLTNHNLEWYFCLTLFVLFLNEKLIPDRTVGTCSKDLNR